MALFNNSLGDFRKKVLETKNNVGDDVFFSSSQCKAYLQNLAEAVSKVFVAEGINLRTTWGSPDDFVAFATGRGEVTLNVNNEFFNNVDGRVNKLVILKALVLHECGHLLFTDFHQMEATVNVFQNRQGQLFPTPKCEEYKDWLTDAALMSEAELFGEWLHIWKYLENSIEDGFIETMVLKTVPGEGQCLYILRNLQKEGFDSIKVQRNKGLDTPTILFNSILSLAKYNTVKMDKDDKDDPAIKALMNNYNLIRKAVNTKKSYDRMKLVNELFCELYKFMKEENEKSNSEDGEGEACENSGDNQSGNGSQGNQGGSSFQNGSSDGQPQGGNSSAPSGNNGSVGNENGEEGTPSNSQGSANGTNGRPSAKSILNGIQKGAEGIKDNLDLSTGSVLNDRTAKDKDEAEPPKSKAEMLESLMNGEDADAQIPTPADMREADSIAEDIAKEKVNAEAEEELANSLEDEAENLDYSKYNRGIKPELTRKAPSEHAREIYEADMKEIGFLSKKMVNEIRNKIKDQQQGGKLNGLYQGRLDSHSLYRYDQKWFYKNSLPEDIPDMALCILIDASGSMSGQKIEIARRTALLLYEFGLQLHVPVMVYSHDTGWTAPRMTALADYGSVDGNDKYRICDLEAGGGNRDGMALRFCSEKLAARREQDKFLFIISDGLPSDYNSQVEAFADIRGVLTDYSKKGVKYIAVGLGSDARHIKDIYTQGLSPKVSARFLDCTDATTLPTTTVRVIKDLIKA